MTLGREEWKELTSSGHSINMLMPMIALSAQQDDPDFGYIHNNQDLKAELTELIPATVAGIYDYWRAHDDLFDEQPLRRSSIKTGRNEPCPCGSGKKYKRCCGRPANMN